MAVMPPAAFARLLAIIKSEDVVEIPVGRTRIAVVDASDEAMIRSYKWRHRNGYAAAPINGVLIRMHHLIVPDVPHGLLIDHIDGDGFNNRRSNLRICTPQENCRNRRKLTKRTKSKFKGVSLVGNGWRAAIQVNGETISLGVFDAESVAARVYDRGARKYHGEFAKTNADLGLY